MKPRIIVVVSLALLLNSCNAPDEIKQKLGNEQAKVERVIPVGIQCVDTVQGLIRHTYSGTIEECQAVDLSFKYGGTLQNTIAQEGTRVKKGDVIARVSSPSLENTRRTAMTTLDQAQDGYNRLKKVYDNGSLPEIKWQEMVANLEKAKAGADLANSMVAENVIRAPFDGIITSRKGEAGQNLSPLAPVVRLINTDGVVVKVSVPENEISQIAIGDNASISIPALNDRNFEGIIVEKGMTASALSHSYPIKIHVDNIDQDLMPGMIGKVALESDVSSGILVPAQAVLIASDGSKFVWIAENGRATRRAITIEGYSGRGVVVGRGLQAGDHVIVEGYQKVSEGMKVSEYGKQIG